MEELVQSPDGDQATVQSTSQDDDQVKTEEEASIEPQTVEIDGEKVSVDQIKEWKQGNMREQDYRKKTQELAEAKREIARAKADPNVNEEVDPDVKAAIETLKKAGVATKEDLLLMKAQQEDERRLKSILRNNPQLKKHSKAIKQIGVTDNRSWEDIVQDPEYGFLEGQKLAKAKTKNPIKGTRSMPGEEKAERLPAAGTKEWEAWKKQNLGGGIWN